MECYPGGTILERNGQGGYDYWYNYLSDLGRRRAWNREVNKCSNQFFDSALYLAAGAIILFFWLIPPVLRQKRLRRAAVIGGLLGTTSALAYLGIAWFPLDVNYRMHTVFVRVGFISFFALSWLFAATIRREKAYPNVFAYVMYIFAAVFLLQISIMLFGPRAWTSPNALWLQVTAQKVIVGLQLVVMFLQIIGAIYYLLRQPSIPE